jgi:biopolymer transport protein ExbD
MGTWSCVITPDEEGIQGYSVSGIGDQGILLAGAAGGSAGFMQTMGLLPKLPDIPGTTYVSGTPLIPLPPVPPSTQQNSMGNTNAAPLLPDAANTTSSAIIYITSENAIIFDSTPVSPDQISDFLKSKKTVNPDLKLTVKVDKDASPDVLSTVMDAGATAGFGVLPYIYTSGTASSPPVTNSNAVATPPLENTATNAAAASTNSAPITNSNSDATPIAPGPPQPQ